VEQGAWQEWTNTRGRSEAGRHEECGTWDNGGGRGGVRDRGQGDRGQRAGHLAVGGVKDTTLYQGNEGLLCGVDQAAVAALQVGNLRVALDAVVNCLKPEQECLHVFWEIGRRQRCELIEAGIGRQVEH
jgi:hypothetical protein